MVSDGKSKVQIAIITFLNQSPRAGLFQRHTHGAVKIRIGRSIDGRKVVKNFSGEIKRPNLIQFFNLVFSHDFVEIIGSLWHNGAFGSFRRRLKIIRAAGSHFVEINVDVRVPLVEKLQPRPALYLGGAEPIPVKIGKVVVATAIGPALAVLLIERICGGESGLVGIVPTGGTISAVRILSRIN